MNGESPQTPQLCQHQRWFVMNNSVSPAKRAYILSPSTSKSLKKLPCKTKCRLLSLLEFTWVFWGGGMTLIWISVAYFNPTKQLTGSVSGSDQWLRPQSGIPKKWSTKPLLLGRYAAWNPLLTGGVLATSSSFDSHQSGCVPGYDGDKVLVCSSSQLVSLIRAMLPRFIAATLVAYLKGTNFLTMFFTIAEKRIWMPRNLPLGITGCKIYAGVMYSRMGTPACLK